MQCCLQDTPHQVITTSSQPHNLITTSSQPSSTDNVSDTVCIEMFTHTFTQQQYIRGYSRLRNDQYYFKK